MTIPDYEKDFYQWLCHQAQALRDRAWDRIDVNNLADEVESLARREKREITDRLTSLLVDLLQWRYQRDERSLGPRENSIDEARHALEGVLEDNPSLHRYPQECLGKAYAYARRKALRQTGLDSLPENCPWTIQQVLDQEFLP
jgi:hypothetical protein